MSTNRRGGFLVAPAVTALLALAPAARAVPDVSGRWYVDGDTVNGRFPVLAQAGTPLTWPGRQPITIDPAAGLFFEPLDAKGLVFSRGGFLADGSGVLAADFIPIAGGFVEIWGGHPCECFDGDTTNGDGCDATCRIEPCFTCTAEPSVCSRSASSTR